MALRNVVLTGTTDGSGDLVATNTSVPVFGFLHSVDWIDGDFADNVTAVLTVNGAAYHNGGAAKTLLTLAAGEADDDATFYPRDTEHDAGATALTTTTYKVIDGYLVLTVAAGGATKTGGCVVHYFD
jgi:hypothetical protein